MNKGQRFDKISREFFLEWGRRNPLLGTSLGMHRECDDRMPDGSIEKIHDDVKFLKRYETEFSRFDPDKLSPSQAVDRELVLFRIKGQIFELAELKMWERAPNAAAVLGEAIFQLLSKNFEPLSDRLRSIMKRLEGVAKYLEQVRSLLNHPIKIHIENELETITRLPGFFNTLKVISWDNLPKTPQKNFLKIIEVAQNALEKYSDWMIVDILPECREEHPIGEKMLKKIFASRDIDQSPKVILAFAEKEMHRHNEKLKDIGKKIKRKVPVEDIRDMIKKQHPDNFDGVLRFSRDQVAKAKQFVQRSNFAEVPNSDGLYVVETPSYLRHMLPHSTYSPPARMEKKQDGYYYVTPGDCDSNKLKEHNFASVASMALRETYPGHHLQALWTMHHPSLLRSLPPDPIGLDGWAYYGEERSREIGYDDSPPTRFMTTLSMLFRAARTVLDIRIATGKIEPSDAVDFLIDHVGMDRIAAEAEVRRYLTTPGQSSSGLLGKEKIKELKKWSRDRMKGRFYESFFNTAVLQSTPLPPKVLKKELEWRIEKELEGPKKPPVEITVPVKIVRGAGKKVKSTLKDWKAAAKKPRASKAKTKKVEAPTKVKPPTKPKPKPKPKRKAKVKKK